MTPHPKQTNIVKVICLCPSIFQLNLLVRLPQLPWAKSDHNTLLSAVSFSFLRSVSYREFSRLVYGILRNRRIPLPACAYTAIRQQFPVSKDERFTGFDLDEEENLDLDDENLREQIDSHFFKCNFYFLTHTIQPCMNQVYCLICGWNIYPFCLWFIFLLTRGGIFYSTVYSNYVSTTGIKFNSCNMHGCLRGPKKEFFACNFHMPVRVRLGYIKLYFILADF